MTGVQVMYSGRNPVWACPIGDGPDRGNRYAIVREGNAIQYDRGVYTANRHLWPNAPQYNGLAYRVGSVVQPSQTVSVHEWASAGLGSTSSGLTTRDLDNQSNALYIHHGGINALMVDTSVQNFRRFSTSFMGPTPANASESDVHPVHSPTNSIRRPWYRNIQGTNWTYP